MCGRGWLADLGGLTWFRVHLFDRCLVGVALPLELDGFEVGEPFLGCGGVAEVVDALEECEIRLGHDRAGSALLSLTRLSSTMVNMMLMLTLPAAR
ncbi:hypothetical protein DIZ27_00350 [Streptomyces sp. NWU339]|nr:hypothetical protein DIZ27_00350 [Streptomyces sp. NWU339]